METFHFYFVQLLWAFGDKLYSQMAILKTTVSKEIITCKTENNLLSNVTKFPF